MFNQTDFESYEYERCRYVGDDHIEVVTDQDWQLGDFYTIYGRLHNGEVVALVDLNDEEQAKGWVDIANSI